MVGPGRRYAERPFTSRPLVEVSPVEVGQVRLALGRLRVALAVPLVQALSPYSNGATVLSKLSVAEGLTVLDEDGVAERRYTAPGPSRGGARGAEWLGSPSAGRRPCRGRVPDGTSAMTRPMWVAICAPGAPCRVLEGSREGRTRGPSRRPDQAVLGVLEMMAIS